jgi:hypothetical protein
MTDQVVKIAETVEQIPEPEKIVIKKASKPKAKPKPAPLKTETKEEKPNVKVKSELDEEEVIDLIKNNENLKKEILKILMVELINKI